LILVLRANTYTLVFSATSLLYIHGNHISCIKYDAYFVNARLERITAIQYGIYLHSITYVRGSDSWVAYFYIYAPTCCRYHTRDSHIKTRRSCNVNITLAVLTASTIPSINVRTTARIHDNEYVRGHPAQKKLSIYVYNLSIIISKMRRWWRTGRWRCNIRQLPKLVYPTSTR
jgi:hypothetical protein